MDGVRRAERARQLGPRGNCGSQMAPGSPAELLEQLSHVQLRAPGSSTDGEMERVRFVGPMVPATRRGRWGSLAVTSLAASTASSTPILLSSYTTCSML